MAGQDPRSAQHRQLSGALFGHVARRRRKCDALTDLRTKGDPNEETLGELPLVQTAKRDQRVWPAPIRSVQSADKVRYQPGCQRTCPESGERDRRVSEAFISVE